MLVEGDSERGIFRGFCTSININQGVDVPTFQQLVSGDVVMGVIQADVSREKPINIAAKFINGKEEVFAVMAPDIRKVYQKGEFHLKLTVPTEEHIKRMSEIPGLIVAVPAPGSIRVGIVPPEGTAERAGFVAGGKVSP